ncbi:tetratricopeptide repeat protein [Bradyrhizobium prioriisuperbiae]|uniref:tetratricopeptide repeat protein n=1 Tax=Bradyrhizobium prioriisuperbiae TaxID=2854389 RepID=UPI0028E966CD|nr:TIR domain-containing protein [Bradyrhizobium prioritasuperba]
MARIFVSYTSVDRDFAYWIGKELQALGHEPHLHDWEIRGSGDILAWMEEQIDEADHTLCVFSDDYLKARYSTLERRAALWDEERPGFALIVMAKPCKIPALFRHFRRCELYDVSGDAVRQRFKQFMQGLGQPAKTTEPLPGLAASNIPVQEPTHFLGRDRELADIETALARDKGKRSIAALHGLRGVGKTTLAAAFAERHSKAYKVTWWIRAQSEATICADLVALGLKLGWITPENDQNVALALVLDRLHHEGENILLIYDNAARVADIKRYLPRGACRIIVTSNASNWLDIAAATVEIKTWSKTTGAKYLLARTGRKKERDAAAALSDLLGGLPLAHEQAAAYCERLDVSFDEYQRRFVAATESMLDKERDAPDAYHDGRTVAATFRMAIEQATGLHPAAEPLIVLAALLAPEPIPLFLFSEAREMLGEPLATLLAGDGFEDAVAALRAFALVSRRPLAEERIKAWSADAIRIHRLVRQIAITRRSARECDDIRRTIAAALADVYPRRLIENRLRSQREKEQLIPHVLTALNFLHADHDAEFNARELLDSMARLVMLTLQDVGAKNISPEYLPTVLADFYEVQPLSETIARLVENEDAWPKLQDRLLDANNYVLRYAMAEAIADAWGVEKISALIDKAKNLNEFELGGYALGLVYARDPQLITLHYLEKLADHPAYPGRSILGDLLLNLALRDSPDITPDLHALLPNRRFWEPVWDFVALDIQTIEAAEAFAAKPRKTPPPSTGDEVSKAYAALLAVETGITERMKHHVAGGTLHTLLDQYFRLGEDPTRIEEAEGELADVSPPELLELMRVFFAHPIWSVAESAATVLSLLVTRDHDKANERLQIITLLLDDPHWRVQFGANEAAFAVRHHDDAVFHRSVERFYDHWNCKIRGLCAENLVALILNSGTAKRNDLLRRHEKQIKFWIRDEDCWVLEHVFRLFQTLYLRGVSFDRLLADGMSRLFDDLPEFFTLAREPFLRHIEQRKIALVLEGSATMAWAEASS